MSTPSPQPSLNGPAYAHIPPGIKAKLRPLAIQKIQEIYDWVENECIPREPVMEAQLEAKQWAMPPVMRELREKAKVKGLFNLFLPNTFEESPGLTNAEYGCIAELLGRCYWAAQTVNCHAPDTGNVELLAKYANQSQKEKWLQPLLQGKVLSAYSMTEPASATSDVSLVQVGHV